MSGRKPISLARVSFPSRSYTSRSLAKSAPPPLPSSGESSRMRISIMVTGVKFRASVSCPLKISPLMACRRVCE